MLRDPRLLALLAPLAPLALLGFLTITSALGILDMIESHRRKQKGLPPLFDDDDPHNYF